MLSDNAFHVAAKLRAHVGSDKIGVGPDTSQLVNLLDDLGHNDLREALDELEDAGFIKIDSRLGAPLPKIPNQFRDVAGVSVLEPLQAYFDDLEP